MQLAHAIPGVRGIYNAAKYLKWRRGMLREYGYWLDTCADGAPVDPVPSVNRG